METKEIEMLVNDLKLALGALYCAVDSEWYGEGTAWDVFPLKEIMKRHKFSKEDIKRAIPIDYIS